MLQCFYGKLRGKDGYGFLETSPGIDESMMAFIKRNAEQFGSAPGRNTVLLPYVNGKGGIVQYLFFHKCTATEPDGRPSDFLHIVIMKSSELQTSLLSMNNNIAQMKFCEDRASIGNYMVAASPYLYRDQNVIMEGLSSKVPVRELNKIIDEINWKEGKRKKSKLFIAFPMKQVDELDRAARRFLQGIFGINDIKFMLKIDFITNAFYNMDIEDLHIVCCREEECAKFREKYGNKCYYYFVNTAELIPARIEEPEPYLHRPEKAKPQSEEQKTVTTEGFVKPNSKDPVKSRADEIQKAKHDMTNRNDRSDAGGQGGYEDKAYPENKQRTRSVQEEFAARDFFSNFQRKLQEISEQNDELYQSVKRVLVLSAGCVCLGILLFIGSMILMLRSPKAQDARKEAVENGSGISGGNVELSQKTYDTLRALMVEAVRTAERDAAIQEKPVTETSVPEQHDVATPSQIEISVHTISEDGKQYVELEELRSELAEKQFSVVDEKSGAGVMVYFFEKIENNRVNGFQISGLQQNEKIYIPTELLKQQGMIIHDLSSDDASSGN